MAFVRMKGIKGLVWQPDDPGEKKHDCPDCFCCQWCSDERCRVCLSSRKKRRGGKRRGCCGREHRK